MTFCWRRFRHFVAAYFAIGLAATITHGVVFYMSLDAIANESEAGQEGISADVDVAELVASEEPLTLNDSEISPEAPVTEEQAAETDPTAAPEPQENDEQATADAGSFDSGVDPSASAEDSTVTPDNVAPDNSVPDNLSAAPIVPDNLGSDTPTEVPAEEIPGEEASAQSPIEPAPVEVAPVEPQPVPEIAPVIESYEEEIPYLEARGIIESVMGKVDWLYTLRPGANYDLLSLTKTQVVTDMNELALIMESQSTNTIINAQFCDIEDGLATLETVLATGSDDSQTSLDADNQDILTEIDEAVAQVRTMWTNETGLSMQCSN